MNVADIRAQLQGYAERGVFQGFGEKTGRSGSCSFMFRWLLGSEFELVVNPRKRELCLKNLLPGITAFSHLDKDLRSFVAGRDDPELPPHRRVDAEIGTLSYMNRKGYASLTLTVADDIEQATKALLTLVNDLFTHLQMYHIDYLHREFDLPEE